MRRKIELIVVCLMLLASCNQANKIAQQRVDAASEDPFAQVAVADIIEMLKNGQTEDFEKCGLKFIFSDSDEENEENEENEVSTFIIVYGRDIEKGEKRELGYELKPTGKHACFLYMQDDTSQQMSMNFVDKDDANRFYERILNGGLVELDGVYIITEEKLLEGKPIHIDSFGDYQPKLDVNSPVFEDGFYRVVFGVYV